MDARSWPVWSAVGSLDTERSSGLDPGGRDAIGAVRAFRTGSVVTGERLTGLSEERQLTYEDAFNPFMRNYHAAVELTRYPTNLGHRPVGPSVLAQSHHGPFGLKVLNSSPERSVVTVIRGRRRP